MKETNEMKEAIQNELKLDPVDKEVVVLYENENKSKDFWKVFETSALLFFKG